MREINQKRYLTSQEVAEKMGVSRRTVLRHISSLMERSVIVRPDPINARTPLFEEGSVLRLLRSFESSDYQPRA